MVENVIIILFVIFAIATVLGFIGIALRNWVEAWNNAALAVANTTVANLNALAGPLTPDQTAELQTAQQVVDIRYRIDRVYHYTVNNRSVWIGFIINILAWILVYNTGWSIQYESGSGWLYWVVWLCILGSILAIVLRQTWSPNVVAILGLIAVILIVFQGNFNTPGLLVAGDGWAAGDKGNFVVLDNGSVVKTSRNIYSRAKLQSIGTPYEFYLVRWRGFSRILVHVGVGTPGLISEEGILEGSISKERALAFNATTRFREKDDGTPTLELASAYPNPWDTAKIDPGKVIWPKDWDSYTRNPALEKAGSSLGNDTDPGQSGGIP